MTKLHTILPAAVIVALLVPAAYAENVQELSEIVISGTQEESSNANLGSAKIAESGLASQRTATSDSARLLQDVPGVSLNGAGGISSLPAIHGLSDDRLRIQVDGMDLMSACPNHMNSALSYIDPTKVDEVTVYAGITPVSVGGDSIGGSIQVKSAPPEFAAAGEDTSIKGKAGTFYRSNGNAFGFNFGAEVIGRAYNLSYSESHTQSDNYTAGRDFKPVAQGTEGGRLIPGDEVGSSAFNGAVNREVGLALRHEGHVLRLNVSRQALDFEGFPNQRMDMTYNRNTLFNLHYTGLYGWGDLEARAFHQDTRHKMDMGPERYFYGTGMPMESKAKTNGALLQGNIILSDRDTLRTGIEYQDYTLYDWWPPVDFNSMGPNTFWNLDYGRRNKFDTFVEWEAQWNPEWLSQVGVRSDVVMTNAGPVQGYNNGLPIYGDDAAAFNNLDHRHIDYNWDMSALVRFTPTRQQAYEAGLSRKTRSPNLYQRYPWSTFSMAALMNNIVGDGNGYIGNNDLTPEVANTVSLTGDWHDGEKKTWGVKVTGYYTHVQDYIDAQRCDYGQCSPANATAASGFLLLRYVNQNARLYGFDLSGQRLLGESESYGSLTGIGLLNYVRGENLTTGDNLYNIMPLNVKVALVHKLKGWSTTAEFQEVADKTHVSQVRNEMKTGDYFLVNLRSSLEWKYARLDLGIENLLNRFYSMPLGGAYVGQGSSMSTNTIPWGVPVPGMGRSFNASLNMHF
jgi:iron complex outermembrane receptor protein